MNIESMRKLYGLFYATVVILFVRKIVRKITSMFDIPVIPVYHEDSSGWYAVRVDGKYYWWDGFNKHNAIDLAQRLSTHESARGHLEVVEIDEPEITRIEATPGFTKSDQVDMDEIYSAWTDED